MFEGEYYKLRAEIELMISGGPTTAHNKKTELAHWLTMDNFFAKSTLSPYVIFINPIPASS